ncbi:MAG TPA: hypothetical protein VIS74_06850 [Chthoniobacterales bacterium]
MNALKSVISGESWKTLFAVVFGTWMAIWVYAVLHNQYLIRIAPEHFTVWHYKMPFFTSYTMLGIAYAFAASFSPGMFLGICLYVSGRLFNRPKFSPKELIFSTFWVWIAVEICSPAAGFWVWHFKAGIYPDWVYPDNSLGLLITQSIQITAYLSGAAFSILLIVLTWRQRKHLARRLS